MTLLDDVARAIGQVEPVVHCSDGCEVCHSRARAALQTVARWLRAEADAIWPPGTYADNPAEAAVANKAAILRALASHLEKDAAL